MNGRPFEIAHRFLSSPNGAPREGDQAVEELSDRALVLRDQMVGRPHRVGSASHQLFARVKRRRTLEYKGGARERRKRLL